MGILSLLLWTPVIGTVLLACIPSAYDRIICMLANAVAAFTFLVSVILLVIFKPELPGLQFSEYFSINPESGGAYALGVDGLSLPMLLLATLLTSIALLASMTIRHSVKAYHICILFLEFGLLGVFMAQDWLLFYIFWEATLIPLYFLIDHWGGNRRHTASLSFILYTMGGSVFIFIGFLALSQNLPEHAGSLMTALTQQAHGLPASSQVLIMLCFLVGFGVKMPVFPLHGWLPLAHVEAPSPVSILLSGVLLKMGAYGLLRVAVLLPMAIHLLQPLLVFLGLFAMLYGALLAWRQSDLKAMIAYSSICNMGLVLVGIACLNTQGITGAVLQMTTHGLIVAALFLLVGLLYERTGKHNVQDYGTLTYLMPRFTLCMSLSLLALMGLPGTAAFIAQLHILLGGFQQWGWLMLLFSATMLITSSYAMRTILLLFTGSVKSKTQHGSDLNLTELIATSVLLTGIIVFGFMPASLLEISANSIKAMTTALSLKTL